MIGSENLKKRIISAIVMILIVLPLIVFGGLYLKVGTVVLGACSMYELLKQKNNMPLFIKIISIISILTGIFIQIISKIIVFIINSKVTYISTIKITNRIINEFNYPSFIFLLVGILSYILYLILNVINKKIPLTSS